MIKVLTEIELTQALIKLKLSNKDTVDQKQLFDQVYVHFNTSKEEFNNSLDYYCKQPKLLEEMYETVINTLSEKQEKFQTN